MKRSGTATWRGAIKSGAGSLATESGVLDGVPYSFAKRFGDETGTNPEELIGAAHAGCYAMALSGVLESRDMTPKELVVDAEVSVVPIEVGFEISAVHLTLRASIPGADAGAFAKAAEDAKVGCPVSKVLNAEITLDASLES